MVLAGLRGKAKHEYEAAAAELDQAGPHRLADPARVAGGRPHDQCGAGEPGRHFRAALPAPGAGAGEGRALSSGYHANLNAKLLGYDLEAYAMVRLTSQAEADLVAFEALTRSWSVVRECVMLSGDIDFMLKCVAPDLTSFQNFIIRDLTAAPNVDHVRTALAMRSVKHEPGVPLE